MKKLKSITITPGMLYHASGEVTTYLVPVEKDNKISIEQKFFDRDIVPVPFDKIFVGKAIYQEQVNINIIDAKEVEDHKIYFNIFKPQYRKDLFSNLKGNPFFMSW